jgi:predicted ATP-dependent protease
MHRLGKIEALAPKSLKQRCDPQHLEQQLKQHENNHKLASPVGQKRAIESIQFGLDIRAKGYNIFVLGPPGSGKTSATLRIVRERASNDPNPPDTCYLYNFDDHYRPIAVQLPQTWGAKLEKQIHQGITALTRSIPQILSEEIFVQRTNAIANRVERKKHEIFEQIAEIADQYDLRMEREDEQFLVVPLQNGDPIESSVYDNLPDDIREGIQVRVANFQNEAAPLIAEQQLQEERVSEQIATIEKEAIRHLVEKTISSIREQFASCDAHLLEYFKGMQAYIMDNYKDLIQVEEEDELAGELQFAENSLALPLPYQINILVSHKLNGGAPVEIEKEPTMPHLFGYIEYQESQFGMATDHTLLRPGSLHRVNGGYLVLQAADLIRLREIWIALKRALRHREIRMQDPYIDPDKPRMFGTIRPYEVPLNLKVILIGSSESYYQLMSEDEDFDRIFKIKAEFESWIPWDRTHEGEYAIFLQRLCREENLLPLEYPAMARAIEECARDIESQHRLSTSVINSLDLLCEADYWAQQQKHQSISLTHIEKALDFREYRHQSIEKNIIEMIDKEEILIETDGYAVGQVNALLVYAARDFHFGIPNKITARTYVGTDGVINIDREAQLSGAIHDKGSMILIGLLGSLWGQDHPLHFNASITFEQLYGEIEGDSASCAEFYALLSSLAQVSIYQGIAVTGSINQIGLVQPIGEANAKIEGMFKICQMRGLTGKQGVIIPVQNVHHLMLKDEVIDAVAQGLFHIWPIQHISDGIEILMGQPAGERQEDESWPPDTLFYTIQQRLFTLHKRANTEK